MKFHYILLLCFNIGCLGQSSDKVLVEKNVSRVKEQGIKILQKEEVNLIQNLKQLHFVKDLDSYESVKNLILKNRKQFETLDFQHDSISLLFKESLVNMIIPFWEGTSWSFEGHTSKPQKGSIACGYFISTTLRDIGLILNRYHLAQQSPINEAKSLAIGSEVVEFSEPTLQKNIDAIDNHLKEGVHFIGFDESHVGYILKQNGNLYLIHSNYIKAEGVLIESIEKSEVFGFFNKFYVVELSTNDALLKNWIKGDALKIVKG